MEIRRTWFQRPLAALCVLTAAVILSVYVILASDGRREGGEDIGFRVSLRHYGSDAGEMESTAAIPLEDALAAIPGISRIISASENGQVRVYVNFRGSRRKLSGGKDEYYEAVREAAQRVYETLPSSAQRPEINSSGDSRVPFWIAAVYVPAENGVLSEDPPDGDLLERVVKPALSGIEGVGDVEIAGSGIREIVIELDREKCAALDLTPAEISSCLAADDALFHGGFLNHNGTEIPLKVDGRYTDLKSLEEALIPLYEAASPFGAVVKLKSIAAVHERNRGADTLSRLNGKKTAVITVSAAAGFDSGALSSRIKKEIGSFSHLPLEFRVLEDRGAEEAKAFKSVFAAALGASLLVAAAAFLLRAGKSSGFWIGLICAGAIPVISIISAALLSAAGFPVNRKFLAGLAVGIGGAVDAVILSAEGFSRFPDSSGNNSRAGRESILKRVCPPLISGAATTVAALLPLAGISAGEDIAVIAGALGTVTLVSVALSLTLLPPLFFWANSTGLEAGRFPGPRPGALPRVFLKNLRRRFFRFIAALAGFCRKRVFVFPVLSLALSASGILALRLTGTDASGERSEDSVYFRVEFEGGFLKEEGDILLAGWAEGIKNHPAVKDIQTGVRTGSGYGLVTFDPRKSNADEIRSLVRSGIIPGAFIHIPEASASDRIWTITVSGDDSEKCRELAREAASLCSADRTPGLSFVKETVLNFKRGGPRLALTPRREMMARGGITFSSAADTVRRGVYGPVAYKRTDGGETDVRIKFSPSPGSDSLLSGEDVLRIPLAAAVNQGIVYSGSIMNAEKSEGYSVINRENRRRIASFSIRTDPGDPRFFRDKITAILKEPDLPPGYKIEFDPEAIRGAEALSGKMFSFIWAVLFCYMIIAAAEESFILPLIILSSIPPSLAVPVLVFVLSGLPVNAVIACALVAVSGMTVNASVISAGELRRQDAGNTASVYRSLRKVLPSLLATAGTTIAGALPFLFLREGSNSLVRTLALVTVIGVGVSFFCSLTLVPSLTNLFFDLRGGWKARRKFPLQAAGGKAK